MWHKRVCAPALHARALGSIPGTIQTPEYHQEQALDLSISLKKHCMWPKTLNKKKEIKKPDGSPE